MIVLNIDVNNYKDFYKKWEDVIGEYTYCHRLYEEKIKKISSKLDSEFDFYALDDIMCCVKYGDQYKCLCLLLIQSKKTIKELQNSFYDKEGNFIDDYSNITYEELEQYTLNVGGFPFKVKSFAFTQYNKEIEILEKKFKTEIAQLKKEQQRLYLENQFLNSHKEDIRQIVKEIIKEKKEKKQ